MGIYASRIYKTFQKIYLPTMTSWWLNQPIWKILVKLDHETPIFGVKIKIYLKPPQMMLKNCWIWGEFGVIYGSKGRRTHVHLAIFYLCKKIQVNQNFLKNLMQTKTSKGTETLRYFLTVSEKYVEDTFEATS